MKLILRQIALVLTFLIIFPAGLSQRVCAATETATKQKNKKSNTYTKEKPKSILAPMARRIDKKVHASYKLPQVSLNNRQVRNIINRMCKDRKDKDVYYAVYDVPIVDSENTALHLLELSEVHSFSFEFIGYCQNDKACFLFDKSMRPYIESFSDEKGNIEFDVIIYRYTKGTPIIDDGGRPSVFYIKENVDEIKENADKSE